MPENSYFAHYIPLLFQVIVAIALAAVMVTLSHLLGKHKWSRAKNTAYECGIEPTGDAQQRFSVKFYLVGMLFILFDVEAVFLYPWAVIARASSRCLASGRCWFTSAWCWLASSIYGRKAFWTGIPRRGLVNNAARTGHY